MGARRRDPISRDRYRSLARGAGIPRPPRVRVLDGILVVAVVVTALVALPRVASGVGDGVGQLVSSIQESIPLLQGRGAIELPPGGSSSVGAAPVIDSLPAFTREPQLLLSGRVPAFAVEPDRTLQVVLNGAVVKTGPLDQSGAFSATLALKEGSNAISIALIANREVVAGSSHTIVLDRAAPALAISQPQAGSTVDPKNVVVAGATEAGSTITVNGRTVITTPQGAFSDSFSATAGTVDITVVARDRAGNETTQRLSVVAQSATPAVGPALAVAVSPASVRPGQQVLATITLRDGARPRVGVQVTLSVGVVVIGSAVTDATGTARIGFAAPTTEGEIGVVVLGGGASGRATLTVSAR